MSSCWRIFVSMENKYINRYRTFCKCLDNLKKSKQANPNEDFVLEGTIMNFNLTFDISWKVMKDILVKQLGILDFAIGSLAIPYSRHLPIV